MESKKTDIPESNAEPQYEKLPPHVLEGIEISIKQYESGQCISLEEFKEKHFQRSNRKT
jgi:hypothetical protein